MQKYCKGVTLIELLVTLAIIAVVTMIGAPSFNGAVRSTRLATSVNEFVTGLSLARSEAIKRNQRVVIRKNENCAKQPNCQWEDGWVVFMDTDGDNKPSPTAADCAAGADCILQLHNALTSTYTLRFKASGVGLDKDNFIRYSPDGGISANGTFYLCDNSDGNNAPNPPYTAKLIIVNTIGRPRLGVDDNKNGIPEIVSNTDITTCIP